MAPGQYRQGRADVRRVVVQGHLDRFAHRLQPGEVDDRLDRSVPREDVIKAALIANVDFLEDDHVVDFACDGLHALEADHRGVAQVVHDDDLGEAAVPLRHEDIDYCVGANVARATRDQQSRTLLLLLLCLIVI